ncbi:heme o synthase [Geomicrobium sp. JCM 19039]|uniref:heme o synthase n=1 Tax=Geomicrobium sp. JCM 19039 TaxID=1460636 RepID=UPI00045F485E|nr:heme O synthase, protoheme IX farnesyltransferase COX10-CtaB [Geomicrobium sp. JCM 19039]
MRSNVKVDKTMDKATTASTASASLSVPRQSISKVIAETVKTGIVKSNLIAMFAGIALALYANQVSPLQMIPEIVFATIGSAFIIGAAGTFNNVYDRDIDSIMERTKNRPTVTGVMPVRTALIFGTTIALLGLLALFFASPLAALFGFMGLFLYVIPYTMWSKRRSIYNTEIGSISGAMPPLIGWAAISTDMLSAGVLGLFVVMLLWQMPHFYAIAIRKHDEYKAAKVPMLPVVKGLRRTYVQTNVYLVALIFASFLFMPLSLGIVLVALILGVGWLLLSMIGYRRMDPQKWAKSMFIYSLNHMSILFATIILYCIVATVF